ncbi:glucan biosynthesis protein [Haloferula sp. BvORR071]|uniref:glucan biosynthesis protein n=1 Tax=Haloferula sp. BvORR071 TaxID=1396141 RepID=UPI000697DDE2|nr:glucan biosynthesis protein [Haloferula sp. BvORR071]
MTWGGCLWASDTGIYTEEAARLAGGDYVPGYSEPTAFSKKLTYDDIRKLHIARRHWLFSESSGNLQVEPLLAGSFNSRGIKLQSIQSGKATDVPFATEMVEFPADLKRGEGDQLAGFRGFRVMGPSHRGGGSYEQFTFGGATYFRGHPEGLNYGLSARGIRLKRGSKEEFPIFERFALEEPAEGSSTITIHALMNGPSVTGAYRIVSMPGNPHTMEVHASIHPRRGVSPDELDLGVAAFSSMFWFNPASLTPVSDFRERVHDSEALRIESNSGECLWRVLANPEKLRETSFPVEGLRGFGLVQREREFSAYEDGTARYERRTSAWVEPLAGMTNGAIKLLEIPAKGEYDDNIAVAFHPAALPPAGEPLEISYRLQWCDDAPRGPLARILQTRAGTLPDQAQGKLLAVDFEYDPAKGMPVPAITMPAGLEAKFSYLKPLPDGKSLRLHLFVKPEEGSGHASMEIRACLRREKEVVSETWVYPWQG